MPNITPILETARLILRPIRIEDAEVAQSLFNDWEVVKYLFARAIEWPLAPDNTVKYYQNYLLPKMAAGETLGWAITNRITRAFMGVFQLSPTDEKDSRGFWLASRHHRQGYISEAIVATTDYGFDELHMPIMYFNNAVSNAGSRRVKETSGAELIETVEEKFVSGILLMERWRLTPEAWRASPMKRAAKAPSYILR